MKIIHVIRGKADPNTMNGVNRIVHSLATEQVAMGRDVEVWGITSSPEDLRHQHEYPLRLFQAFGLRMRLPQPLLGAVAELAVDDTIVHFHSVFVLEYFALARALERRGIQWVQSPHGGYAPEAWRRNRWRKRLYFALFEQNLVRGAAAAQATGKGELNDVAALAPRLASVLIPNGQEILERAAVARPEGAEIRFGYCGRLATRQKALDLLLEGFALYRRQGGKGTLHLVGDGPDRSSLEQLAKSLGIEELVTFAGPAFGADKIAQLCQFDALVHSSRWEGLAMMLLEASALGIPVIVSEETNFGDHVRQFGCGIVLETNDSASIASALHQASEMRETGDLERAGASGRKMIAETFSWRAMAQRVETELYGRPLVVAPRSRSEVLAALFVELELSGIPYVTVGDARRYPLLVAGDVDLVFDQPQVDRATRLVRTFARRHGLYVAQILRHEHTAYYVCLAWFAEGRLQVLKLDYCGDYLRHARRLLPSGQLLEGRAKHIYDHKTGASFTVPSMGNAFLYYLMKRLDKQRFSEDVTAYLSELWALDALACRTAFLITWPEHAIPDLVTLLQATGQAASEAARRLREQLHRARPVLVRDWFLDQRRKVSRFVRPTGLFMAVVGPDGAGKSSVIAATVSQVGELFRRQQLDHMRPGVLPQRERSRGPVTDPHSRPPYGGAASVLKLGYLVADYILGFPLKIRVALARTTLVVFDRYYHDVIADPQRWRYGGPPKLPAALGGLVPVPDISLVLDAPAEVIHARKKEVSIEACRQQIAAYRSVAEADSRNSLIDASSPLTAVVEQGVTAVIMHMTRRIRRRHE